MASLLETDILSAFILLIVGVVAIVLALLLLKEYLSSKSGIIISFVPFYTAFVAKDIETTSAFFGIGGLLISFGGVLLAFAKLGNKSRNEVNLLKKNKYRKNNNNKFGF